jgi:hypothetical protein
MDALFSNRLRVVKVLLAAAAFAALCRQAGVEIGRAHPEIELMPAHFDALRGRTVIAVGRRVSASDAEAIEVATLAGPIRILGQTSPPARPGDVVSATGDVVGPREIRPTRLRLHPGFAWKRALNYAVSALTLAVFVLWALRRFGLRFPADLLRSRH